MPPDAPPCQRGNVPLNRPLLDRLHRALREEQGFAAAEHERIARLPPPDRVALGACWAPVRFDPPEPAGRGVEVVARGDLHDGIGAGDAVDVGGVHGRCVAWGPRSATLWLESPPPPVRVVDRRFDPTGWVRLRQALERADGFDSPLVTALLDGAPAQEPVPDALPGLDAAQARAAAYALGQPALAAIHGPPGTGKTHVLTAILVALARGGDRPWALAESNAAVDHLALSAHRAGLRVVRVGPTYRIGGELAGLTLDARLRDGPYASALLALDAEISRQRKAGGPALGRLLDERRRLRGLAREHALASAQVIATTFGTLARVELPPAHTAVVDELTQAVEPSVWVAVPRVQRLIVAGDPEQLGPVVLQPGNPLATGLLDRLVARGDPFPMLEVQHRMHASIQALVSDVYGHGYRPAPAVAAHGLADLGARDPFDGPVLFVDTAGAGGEQIDPATRSISEPLEVAVVGRALGRLRDAGLRPDQIAVIAPYSAQVRRIAALPEAADVDVATVNAFQGREREAVIVSFTRNNPDGDLGFLGDLRRLVVSLTRARRALLLVGDSATLGRHPRYASLLARVPTRSVWEPDWADLVR